VLDFQLAVPIAFLLLAAAGLVYGVFAVYLYFRFEQSPADKHVPVAISALTIHYVLVWSSSYVRGYVLLPTLLLFLMVAALVMAIWFGSRAQSKAGNRIAWAGAFTLAAFICRTALALKIQHWS
jgi:hypothetical protein